MHVGWVCIFCIKEASPLPLLSPSSHVLSILPVTSVLWRTVLLMQWMWWIAQNGLFWVIIKHENISHVTDFFILNSCALHLRQWKYYPPISYVRKRGKIFLSHSLLLNELQKHSVAGTSFWIVSLMLRKVAFTLCR